MRRMIRSRGGGVSLVIEEGVRVDQILDLSHKTLFNKFQGCRVRAELLRRWVLNNWLPVLVYEPTFYILS
jgi:hypothetical protein